VEKVNLAANNNLTVVASQRGQIFPDLAEK
jgi:hypothetical protein